jgi:hypothetical protein
MPSKIDIASALKAGIVGSVVMTVIMYGLPLVGLPRMDIMAALGSVFPLNISPYIPGFLIHFGIGVALAIGYALFFFGWLPGPNWLKGAAFSLLPWLFAITLLGPSLQLAAQIFGAGSSVAANPGAVANPCAPKAKNPCASANPCATKAPANPCAQQATNPCAVKPANPGAATNPCATKAPSANPCAAQTANPCAAVAAANPRASGAAAQASVPPQVLSLVVHLIFGAVVGSLYRPRA